MWSVSVRWSVAVAFLTLSGSLIAADPEDAPQRRPGRFGPVAGYYKDQITPNWFHNDTRFWYRNNLPKGAREFILVDAELGKRGSAFDHAKLATSLAKATGTKVEPDRLPFDAIEFVEDGKAVRFRVDGTAWQCDLTSYECIRSKTEVVPPKPGPEPAPLTREALALLESPFPDGLAPDAEERAPQEQQQQRQRPFERERSPRSPDGKWTASVKDYNLFVRDADGKETQLTKDGKAGLAYGMFQWSPDSEALVAWRTEPGDAKEVYVVESSPSGGGRAKLHTRQYDLPGDTFASHELFVFDLAAGKQIKADVDRVDFGTPRPRWGRDGRHFTYQKVDRGHQRFRLIEVDAHTGKSRNIIDEKSDTFIWTAHGLGTWVQWLEKTDELLYASEREGWRHLYLIDVKDGKVKNHVTQGEWVVRAIDRVDEDKRQIWFRACGRNAGQDPYFIHHYRVNFDGTELVALTEGNGDHSIRYSPDRKYLIDTYSRADMAPVHELRRALDGKLVCELEKADISELKANGWEAPEVFTAKGRDGKTDIWGLIHRPRKLDPSKKYPVIESIYAGPHDSHVPKRFSPFRLYTSLRDLGFIVVHMDGMGTANRSKAFHDVCWHNLKDAGFPDRILWHKAVAQKYSYYDIDRVGIYGTSAGGQNSTGALLFHGDFYKAAVSSCGCHDNRMDKASWNEQWMGYPVAPHYAASSNIDNAFRLRGKLLLMVGELDDNVPPESTLRLVDALIKARKDFELIVLPGQRHTGGGTYGARRLEDFFVRHLQGVTPPDRNAIRAGGE